MWCARPSNLDPISDPKNQFSTPYFPPNCRNRYAISYQVKSTTKESNEGIIVGAQLVFCLTFTLNLRSDQRRQKQIKKKYYYLHILFENYTFPSPLLPSQTKCSCNFFFDHGFGVNILQECAIRWVYENRNWSLY